MEYITHNAEEMRAVADELLRTLSVNRDRAFVVGLSGNLGAGKTTFVQQVAKLLGISENVVSPTFIIFKKYEIKESSFSFKKLIHVDAYRLKNGEDLKKLGFELELADPNNLILIEWPEKVADLITPAPILLFEHGEGNERKILKKS